MSCNKKGGFSKNNDHRPSVLKNLDGEWYAEGQVMGDSVHYIIHAKPVLQSMFSEINMREVNADSSPYEAKVFIGYDSISKKIYTHWLDVFGGAYSIPHGSGTLDSTKMEFFINYPSSIFRDLFLYNKTNNTWQLIIESKVDSITWKNFASYTLTKNLR